MIIHKKKGGEGEGFLEKDAWLKLCIETIILPLQTRERECVCVCVCVCEGWKDLRLWRCFWFCIKRKWSMVLDEERERGMIRGNGEAPNLHKNGEMEGCG